MSKDIKAGKRASRQSREGMNDKIIRLIANDMQSRKNNGIWHCGNA